MKFVHALIFFIILFIYNVKNVFAYKDWLSFGGTGINNNRNGDDENLIYPANVNSLKVRDFFSNKFNLVLNMLLIYSYACL
jgi:hypothetical protein